MKKLIAAASLFALALTITLPAAAQDKPYDHKPAEWWSNLEAQLADNLNSPIDQVRAQSIRHIIFFAANYSEKAEFSDSVPGLLGIYDNDGNEKFRVLALAAIDAIGSGPAMEYLAQRIDQEESERVQRMMVALLSHYYNGDGSSS